MLETKKYTKELTSIVENLPEEKVREIIEFAKFLIYKDTQHKISIIDNNALFLQQQALKNIWSDPEEDIYEL